MFQQDSSIPLTPILTHIGSVIAAIGGLGTASFGLVDATKSIAGGVSNRGFGSITKTMATLLPDQPVSVATRDSTAEPPTPPALALKSILISLKSNWINGVSHDDQVAIAKSLVKLRLDAALAPSMALLVGVSPVILTAVAAKIASGQPLDKDETDVYGRFDLVLTTLLDQAYQRADQEYRNTAKICAVIASMLLAVAGAAALKQIGSNFLTDPHFWQALLIGLLATPLAPIAKDVASAIQAGARAVQVWRS